MTENPEKEAVPCRACQKPEKHPRKGLCQACYRYEKRHGTTDRKGQKPSISFELIQSLSERSPDGCLVWKGALDGDGKPRYYDPARHAAGEFPLVYVRRWILEQELGRPLERGEIAEDSCDKVLCVDRTHLSLATMSTARRTVTGINSRKTHCDSGHEFTPENTYINPEGKRKCRQCAWESQMRHLGMDPSEMERGPANADKVNCPNGHPYAGGNLFINVDGYRVCLTCRTNNHLKREYGITFEHYMEMLDRQNYQCAICFKEIGVESDGRRTAVVDHDHTTAKVRGLLCSRCNTALGMVFEDVETLKSMIRYKQYHG